MGVARGFLRTIRGTAGVDRPTVYCECRRCGRTLDESAEPCPSCGAEDVAEYSF